jgi:hypothetical protein
MGEAKPVKSTSDAENRLEEKVLEENEFCVGMSWRRRMSEKLRVSWLRKHLQGVRPGDGVINSCEHVLGQSLDVRRRPLQLHRS